MFPSAQDLKEDNRKAASRIWLRNGGNLLSYFMFYVHYPACYLRFKFS